MARAHSVVALVIAALLGLACSSTGSPSAPSDAGTAGSLTAPGPGAGTSAGGGAAGGNGQTTAGGGGSGAVGSSGASAAGSAGTNSGGSAGGVGSAGAAGSAPVSPGPLDLTACVPGTGKTIYVSPDGTPQGDGTSFAQALDFQTARTLAAPGDTLLLEPGRYSIPYTPDAKNTLELAQKGEEDQRIRVIADAGGRAEFDFSFPEQAWVQDSFGFLVSGSYWSFCRIDITRAGYQGAYVTGQHNTFENCSFHDNRNTGLEINKGGAYTTVINCDAYRNYDPKKLGSMADGFGPKETQGPGNRFYGCRAWENSDDGYDAYNSAENVTFERCFAFRNGVDVWNYGGFAGNGNGFKVGGAAKQANHRVTQCAAFANPVKGFDQNNNTGGLILYNDTAFGNGTNFGLGGALNPGQKHDLRNNVSVGAPGSVANATELSNSWNLGLTVTNADFQDLDVSHASAARAADGSLAPGGFLQLASGSQLLDKGSDVGLPFHGSAPDLGAFEAP